MKETNIPIFQALWQIPLLLVVASLIALAVNYQRESPLSLIGDWSGSARLTDLAGDNMAIPLNEAKQLFDQKAAKFVDARPQQQYDEGHIDGALSLPWQDITNKFMESTAQLEEQDVIIAYCDGESCELSHDLAVFLKDMGFANVRVLVNGWTVWITAGLPTQKAGAANEQ